MQQFDAAAFVEENLKTIFAYALSRLRNQSDAEDLTGDIIVAILQSARKIQNPDAFYGYVWKIAANTYRNFLRKRSRLPMAEAETEDELPDDVDFTVDIAAREDAAKLRREIALLSKEYRECTVAYYYDGLSCAEIARKHKISLEMVKYYLFKTRKILREGISMEREFGEKSFNPAPFNFYTIFSGDFNREYLNLFSRKLPGQILMAAYYTPMTVWELAVELGVASLYLEDEIALLETYNLLTKLPSGKYQTKLVIFTDGFTEEFYKAAEAFAIPAIGEIVTGMKEKLGQIRSVNRTCEQLSDERLLWALLWPVMRLGNMRLEEKYPAYRDMEQIYPGATGVNYGISEAGLDAAFDLYRCNAFAGYAGLDKKYYAVAADFGVLPEKNRFFNLPDRRAFLEKVYKTVAGETAPAFMTLSEKEEGTIFEILAGETKKMAEVYDRLFQCGCRLMRVHAPKSVHPQVERIIFQTLIFRTVGFIGGCAVKSEALPLPDFDGPAAVLVRENTAEAEAIVDGNVQMNS